MNAYKRSGRTGSSSFFLLCVCASYGSGRVQRSQHSTSHSPLARQSLAQFENDRTLGPFIYGRWAPVRPAYRSPRQPNCTNGTALYSRWLCAGCSAHCWTRTQATCVKRPAGFVLLRFLLFVFRAAKSVRVRPNRLILWRFGEKDAISLCD